MSEFKFKLHQYVQLSESAEEGFVVGRAEYVNKSPEYLIRLRTADGRQVEAWWSEDAVAAR